MPKPTLAKQLQEQVKLKDGEIEALREQLQEQSRLKDGELEALREQLEKSEGSRKKLRENLVGDGGL